MSGMSPGCTLVPAIHVFPSRAQARRGCPAIRAFTPVFDKLWPGMTKERSCTPSLIPIAISTEPPTQIGDKNGEETCPRGHPRTGNERPPPERRYRRGDAAEA